MPQPLTRTLVPRNYKAHPKAKLTPEQVADIRTRWVPKSRGWRRRHHQGPSISALAKEYGVGYYAIWCALNRATYIRVAA